MTDPTGANAHPEDRPTHGGGISASLRRCLERLRGGSPGCYRGVNLWLAPDGFLEVRVHPAWREDEPTGLAALDDLAYAREVIVEAAALCPEISEMLSAHPWRFAHIHDDETGFTSYFDLGGGRISWSLELL